jgi:DNA-binding CsgD family transcriptional regulator
MAASAWPSTLRKSDVAAIVDIGRKVASSLRGTECAHEVLASLRDLVPFDAAEFAVWDEAAQEHRVLVNDGYPDWAVVHLTSIFPKADPCYQMVRAGGGPARIADAPVDYRTTDTFRKVCEPLGFQEGLTACLKTVDGRYTGMLILSTASIDHPSATARATIANLGSTLACVTDVTRVPAAILSMVEPDAEAALVSPSGSVSALPRHEPGAAPLYAHHAIAMLRSPTRPRRLMFRDQDADGAWLRLTLVRIESPEGGSANGREREACLVIAEREDEPPFGLTRRELDVLSLLVRGDTNQEIGAALFISRRTVSTHVEHLFEKLGLATRAGAAALAVDQGLILPSFPGGGPVESDSDR